MIFMCVMDYRDPEVTKRTRPAHRSYMFRLIDEGGVVSAGSFLPGDDGGLFLYDAPSLADAQRLVDQDPYVREGAVRSYQLRRYEVHGANPALLEVDRP